MTYQKEKFKPGDQRPIMTKRQAVHASRSWRECLAAAAATRSAPGTHPAILELQARWLEQEARKTKAALDGYIARGGTL
jgi:hypothetical protein